jgi:hypothetical protein
MKYFIYCFWFLIAFSVLGFGQDKIDVVYLKNGDIRKGKIIENVPNDYLRIQIFDGSVFTLQYSDIQKMSKEEKTSEITQSPSPNQEHPQGLMARTYDLGVSVGLSFGGEINLVYIGTIHPKKDAGLIVRVFYDEYLIENIAVGVYINFSPVSFKGQISAPDYQYSSSYFSESANTSLTMFEIGGSLKARFPFAEGGAVLKIGGNVGYRKYSADSPLIKSDALGLNVSIEIQFKTDTKIVPFIETGFFSQPVGGNDLIDLTFSPLMYLSAGVAF